MAASCIGVVFLVVVPEIFRRTSKEFDRWIILQHQARVKVEGGYLLCRDAPGSEQSDKASLDSGSSPAAAADAVVASPTPPCRPNLWQQAVRAALHTVQFTLAYFVML